MCCRELPFLCQDRLPPVAVRAAGCMRTGCPRTGCPAEDRQSQRTPRSSRWLPILAGPVRSGWGLILLAAWACGFSTAGPLVQQGCRAAEPGTVDFNRDVRPLLSDHCFQCHGPDARQRQADLRLDTRGGVLADRDGAPVIVPGNRAGSPLFQRLTSDDPDLRMPPADSGRQLTSEQIAIIGRWIDAGAPWQEHWSLVPPSRPRLPEFSPSEEASWCRNPLDHFVLAALREHGLQPAAEADQATLLRRVTLDLTGLPPTPKQVDALRADTAPDAYERAVERLLQSPHFGERLALPWLDAARFADTSGYQTDGVRHMWRWRDWVIEALNRNLPFDQFTVEQLAGDLLPDATLEQRVATGFNRNHRANSEGGIVFEEFLAEYAADRVETTATVWLGLTLGCARCHDHKYDPVTQEDFYRLLAYFNNVPERGRVIKYGNSAPVIQAPTARQREQLRDAELAVRQAAERFRSLRGSLQREQREWERTLVEASPADATSGQPMDAEPVPGTDIAASNVPSQWTVEEGLAFHLPLDRAGADGAERAAAEPPVFRNGVPSPLSGPWGRAVQLDGRCYLDAGLPVELQGDSRFTLSAWIRPAAADSGTVLSWMNAEDSRAAGLCLDVEAGRLRFRFGPRWLDDALRIVSARPLKTGVWQHVCVVYDGSQLADGVQMYVDGQAVERDVQLDMFTGTFALPYPLHVGARGEEAGWRGGLDEVRGYGRMLSAREVAVLACADELPRLAGIAPDRRNHPQRAKLEDAFLGLHAERPVARAFAGWKRAERELQRLRDSLPTTMVMQDRDEPRETFILERGQYDRPGRQVTAGVPGCLPPLPPDAPPNRLALARWLVSPDNPLPARVAVNRYWQTLFGQGLVRTMEDFGVQGEPPSHPELLDWLAVEFVARDWDVKHLLRLMVTSATYRQSSQVTAEKLAADPDNRLLSRGTRLRLPAELLRDQALAAGGLLVRRIGGPSVKPYQPQGLWEEIASDSYQQDDGASLFRRGMYTFWKRTVPPPTMVTFDATSRETCTARRTPTNTPLQALVLLNETTFVEAARGLALGMLRDGGDHPPDRLSWGFRRLLARPPSPRELAILQRCLDRSRQRFAGQPAAASQLLSVGTLAVPNDVDPVELAAYTLAANLMLNLDEAIVRP